QPVVENAVKHGIAPRQRGGHVTVGARLENGPGESRRLCLTVQDTGAGTSEVALAQGRQTGVGLRNIERRLAHQYGSAASLSIQTVPGAGTTVEIRVPTDAPAAREDERRWTAM